MKISDLCVRYTLISFLPVLAIFNSGCSTLKKWDSREIAWQTLHVIDVAQTYNGVADDECYVEDDPLTKKLIGETPSKSQVLAWGLGSGLFHKWFNDKIRTSRRLHPVFKDFVFSLDISYKGYTVAHNHELGVRPVGDNDYHSNNTTYDCARYYGKIEDDSEYYEK